MDKPRKYAGRLWGRVRVVLLGLVGMLGAAPSGASAADRPGADRQLLEARVLAVRQQLFEAPADDAGNDPARPYAQWFNWNNWNNWGNWGNWPNWRNWGNWFNR